LTSYYRIPAAFCQAQRGNIRISVQNILPRMPLADELRVRIQKDIEKGDFPGERKLRNGLYVLRQGKMLNFFLKKLSISPE